MDNLVWITNIEQANFYINHGARVVGINQFKDGSYISVGFTKEETKKLYYLWKKQKGLRV